TLRQQGNMQLQWKPIRRARDRFISRERSSYPYQILNDNILPTTPTASPTITGSIRFIVSSSSPDRTTLHNLLLRYRRLNAALRSESCPPVWNIKRLQA